MATERDLLERGRHVLVGLVYDIELILSTFPALGGESNDLVGFVTGHVAIGVQEFIPLKIMRRAERYRPDGLLSNWVYSFNSPAKSCLAARTAQWLYSR